MNRRAVNGEWLRELFAGVTLLPRLQLTGKTSEATTVAEAIDDITENYVADSGDGSKVITPNLICISEVEIKEE